MRSAFLSVCLFVTLWVAPVEAHVGPRVWIGNVGGRITTFTSDNDASPSTYTPSRVFATELEDLGGIFTTDFPGYEVRRTGGDVVGETTFAFDIDGPALYFDESSGSYITTQIMFGPPQPGPIPQLAISLGSEVRATAAGPVGGFAFFTFHGIGDHSHLSYTLLGDGVSASDGPAGVYAIPLSLRSTSLASSETFYLLLGKGVEIDDELFQTAITVAESTLVSPVVKGDMDCNGTFFDAADRVAFIQAAVNPSAYVATHQGCDILRGDMNDDGVVDGRDVQGFVGEMFD